MSQTIEIESKLNNKRKAEDQLNEAVIDNKQPVAKLYYSSTSCGAASFISAVAAEINLEVEQVDVSKHVTASGVDFYTINPKGNLPTLKLQNGTLLNENIGVLLWIADQKPGSIAPIAGSEERYKLLVVLSFIASEIHPSINALCSNITPDVREYFTAHLNKKLVYLSSLLSESAFLVDDNPSVADYYTYILLVPLPYIGFDLNKFGKLPEYFDRLKALEQVQKAMSMMDSTPPPSNTV